MSKPQPYSQPLADVESSTFRAKWCSRRLALGETGKLEAVWTPQHRRMMVHIGLAIKAECYVTVTFRKPTPEDKVEHAAEIGECLIIGHPIKGRKRK